MGSDCEICVSCHYSGVQALSQGGNQQDQHRRIGALGCACQPTNRAANPANRPGRAANDSSRGLHLVAGGRRNFRVAFILSKPREIFISLDRISKEHCRLRPASCGASNASAMTLECFVPGFDVVFRHRRGHLVELRLTQAIAQIQSRIESPRPFSCRQSSELPPFLGVGQ